MTIIHAENNVRLILKGKHNLMLNENHTLPMCRKGMSALSRICLLSCLVVTMICRENAGTDIGFSCESSAECRAGNGGAYSKCHTSLSKCICTVTLIGEEKCNFKAKVTHRHCKRRRFYMEKRRVCSLICSAAGTWQWSKNKDWYGTIPEQFSSIHVFDRKTSVCYDPERALNSLPHGFTVKSSSVQGAGLGVFTEVFVQRDTVFGPYKGVLDHGDGSPYSWTIDTAKDTWVDAGFKFLSNWLRYINMPTSVEKENLIPLQYKDEMYYVAFKTIPPGSELFVWYGEEYGATLGIKHYDPPKFGHAASGYAGGSCPAEKEAKNCLHDKNTICVAERCFCLLGTTLRSKFCIQDETLGGKCNGPDGRTCRGDEYTECQRGVCICKNNTSLANGQCIPDEMVGGRCAGHDGDDCLLDTYAECASGFCYCKYGTSQVGPKCEKDGGLNGECLDGQCRGKNVVCVKKLNKCVCRTGHYASADGCLKQK